jgi:Spy/CpxP family protein refolding chaperone
MFAKLTGFLALIALIGVSTAAFAADMSPGQSANAQVGYSQWQGAQQSSGTYDGLDMNDSTAS